MRAMVEKLTVIGLPGDGASGRWRELFDIDWDLLDEQDLIEITNDVGLRRCPSSPPRGGGPRRRPPARLGGAGVADSAVVRALAKLSRGAAGCRPTSSSRRDRSTRSARSSRPR
jgi:proteasome accessory factor C